MVADALETIPSELAEQLENIAIIVQDWPTEQQLDGRQRHLARAVRRNRPHPSLTTRLRGGDARPHHDLPRPALLAGARRRRSRAQGARHGAPRGRSLLRLVGSAVARARVGMTRCVVWTLGADRPGIAAAVTGPLLELGGNLEDCSMTILSGQFAMVLVVERAGRGRSWPRSKRHWPGRRRRWISGSRCDRSVSRPALRRPARAAWCPSTAPTIPGSCTGS